MYGVRYPGGAYAGTDSSFVNLADLWDFVDGAPIQNRYRRLKDLPARTDVSDAMSKDLKKRGFTFVGSTICYAMMQSIGMVNDHVVDCHRYRAVSKLA